MTSIHDLKLGSNTLEVLEVILNSLEAFPGEIAKLDLSKFTQIASNIDNLVNNATEVQNNISDMKIAIQNSKTEFDTNKADFDTQYRQFGQDLVTAEAIKQTILDTQNAINMIKNGVDEAKTYLDTFNAKYDKFSKEYNTIMALSANIDSMENLLNNLRDVLNNGVIDDNNVSAQKTYSSNKVDATFAKKTEVEAKSQELKNKIDGLTTTLNTKTEELTNSLNEGLETKLSKAEYMQDKPTFATKDELSTKVDKSELSPSIPPGLISMWSGSIDSIPTGWALCDGTQGTPNLVDRFIIGAGNTYSVGSTGGSADAIIPLHSHTIPAHTHTGTADSAGAHAHNVYVGVEDGSNYPNLLKAETSYRNSGRALSTASVGAHTHSITINSGGSGTTSSVGSSATNANLPPYYALAYIMKL